MAKPTLAPAHPENAQQLGGELGDIAVVLKGINHGLDTLLAELKVDGLEHNGRYGEGSLFIWMLQDSLAHQAEKLEDIERMLRKTAVA